MSDAPPLVNRPGPAATDARAHPAVRVRGLTKHYGPIAAVDDLDLDVPEGSIFGLIGPNGAGKTTTMLALVTLLVPDGGSVEVFGHDALAEPREVRRHVGYMPDFFGVYEGLSCTEYLDFFAAAFGLPAAERRRQVADLLELVDLTHKAGADVSELSRGMQQRLGLARALVHDPRLLVLDEPASGLDPRARVDLREILLELSRQGRTIVVSSHILAELEEMCDRVGIIETGNMLAQGTPGEIRRRLRGGLTVIARVLGGPEEAQRAAEVALAAGAVHAAVDGTRMRAEMRADAAGDGPHDRHDDDAPDAADAAAAALLAALVDAGVTVVEFREERGGLERLFLSVTKGIVQ